MFYQRLHRKLYEFEDARGVTRNRKSKKNRKYNDPQKKDKQCFTKDYTENCMSLKMPEG